MSHADLAPHAAVLLVLLVAAAIDVRCFLIPNRLCLAIFALLPLGWALGGPMPPAWSSACAFGLTTLSVGLLWQVGKSVRALRFGGGDWKLLSALSPWVGLPGLADLLLSTALAGGVLTVFLVLARVVVPRGSRLRDTQWAGPVLASAGIPYGVAIAAGGFLGIVDLAARASH